MPYTKGIHANLGHVDRKYKDMLDQLCAADKRGIKDELEFLIEHAFKSASIPYPSISKK